jgi:hypothetical protein
MLPQWYEILEGISVFKSLMWTALWTDAFVAVILPIMNLAPNSSACHVSVDSLPRFPLTQIGISLRCSEDWRLLQLVCYVPYNGERGLGTVVCLQPFSASLSFCLCHFSLLLFLFLPIVAPRGIYVNYQTSVIIIRLCTIAVLSSSLITVFLSILLFLLPISCNCLSFPARRGCEVGYLCFIFRLQFLLQYLLFCFFLGFPVSRLLSLSKCFCH